MENISEVIIINNSKTKKMKEQEWLRQGKNKNELRRGNSKFKKTSAFLKMRQLFTLSKK